MTTLQTIVRTKNKKRQSSKIPKEKKKKERGSKGSYTLTPKINRIFSWVTRENQTPENSVWDPVKNQ